jgi:hypothetical protein
MDHYPWDHLCRWVDGGVLREGNRPLHVYADVFLGADRSGCRQNHRFGDCSEGSAVRLTRPSRAALLLFLSSCQGPDYEERPRRNVASVTEQAPLPAMRPDPFEGAPAFVSAPPPMRATKMHADGNVGVVPSKSVKCKSCHGGSEAPRFAFAGSAYEDRAGTAPAPDVELGLVDAHGKTFFVHTDADGNFWIEGAATMTFPAYAAIRTADMKKPMKRKIGSADDLECNSCHDAGNPIQKP